jgi:hypothetical protein
VQQSPAQQDAPDWQQLAPQHGPQQTAPGVQQLSLASAKAGNDDSARTKTANSLNFMGFSSRFHCVDAHAAGRRDAPDAQKCKQAHREV